MIRSLIVLLVFVFVYQLSIFEARSQEKYAFIIGVSGYPAYPEGRRLSFPDDDAEDFKELLLSKYVGFKPENITILTNDSATRENILTTFLKLKDIGYADLVYVFYSGHGFRDLTNEAYIMPFDADPNAPKINGITVDDFTKEIQLIPSKHKILFVDACYSGSVAMNEFAKNHEETILRELYTAWSEKLTKIEPTNMSFYSTGKRFLSYEDPKVNNGIFTYHLINGLKGSADKDGNGEVKSSELIKYLQDSVNAHAQKEFGENQFPNVSPNFDPVFVLSFSDPSYQIKPWVEPATRPLEDLEDDIQSNPIPSNSDEVRINELRETISNLSEDEKVRLLHESSFYRPYTNNRSTEFYNAFSMKKFLSSNELDLIEVVSTNYKLRAELSEYYYAIKRNNSNKKAQLLGWQGFEPIDFSSKDPLDLLFGTQSLKVVRFKKGLLGLAIESENEISPRLTKSKKINSSISSFAQIDDLVITGSNDGLVHFTKDFGKSWTNTQLRFCKEVIDILVDDEEEKSFYVLLKRQRLELNEDPNFDYWIYSVDLDGYRVSSAPLIEVKVNEQAFKMYKSENNSEILYVETESGYVAVSLNINNRGIIKKYRK